MISKEIIKGSLKFFILHVLESGEDYGYGISHEIKKISKELLTPTEGSLYPALYKLESEGFIFSHWNEKYSPKRKYYSITKKGRELLKKQNKDWKDMTYLIGQFLNFKKIK